MVDRYKLYLMSKFAKAKDNKAHIPVTAGVL
jgi:hypothetical protein